MVWHAPGFIVGLYFLSLHFLATLDLSYLVLLIGAVFLLLAQPALAWRKLFGVPTGLAVALFASTWLSLHNSSLPRVNVNLGVAQIPGLLIYAIVALCVRDPRQLLGIVFGFCIALPATLWAFATASLHSGFSRAVQLIYHGAQPLFLAANDMLIYAVFMPLVVWFALRELRGRPGAVLAGAYVATLVLLAVLLLSRLSMLLIAAYGFFHVVGGRSHRVRYAVLLVCVSAAAALLFDEALLHKLETLDLARLRTWIAALAMFADAPWFGHGAGSFSLLYPDYLHNMPESIRFGREIRDIGWAHSLFFEAAAEQGLLGLGVTIAYFVYLFAALRGRLRDGGDGLRKALRATAFICLVAAVFELSMLRVWGVYAIYLLLALVAVFGGRPRTADDAAAP
jgi:O-antigen ligase